MKMNLKLYYEPITGSGDDSVVTIEDESDIF